MFFFGFGDACIVKSSDGIWIRLTFHLQLTHARAARGGGVGSHVFVEQVVLRHQRRQFSYFVDSGGGLGVINPTSSSSLVDQRPQRFLIEIGDFSAACMDTTLTLLFP